MDHDIIANEMGAILRHYEKTGTLPLPIKDLRRWHDAYISKPNQKIRVHCTTNLDIENHECWPMRLPTRPAIGDRIRSKKVWKCGSVSGFQLELEVVGVTWAFDSDGWYLHVEMHDPQRRSITDFFKWYAPLVGQSVSRYV